MFGFRSSSVNHTYPCYHCGKRTAQAYYSMRVVSGVSDARVRLRCEVCTRFLDYDVPVEVTDHGVDAVYAYLAQQLAERDDVARRRRRGHVSVKHTP